MSGEAMFCEHANEVPMACPCAHDCYCKTHTCRPAEKELRMVAIHFEADGTELEAIERFVAEHETKHGGRDGSIGGRFTYAFTPTSLGVVCVVKCACGESKDVTQYEDW